jgi:hypothetical protein
MIADLHIISSLAGSTGFKAAPRYGAVLTRTIAACIREATSAATNFPESPLSGLGAMDWSN